MSAHASDAPVLQPFAPEQVATVNGLSFSPDGETLYTSRLVEERDPRGRRRARIVRQTREAAGWSKPEAVGFSKDFTDYQPVLSPDGRRLYFTSTRPLPGTLEETRQNVWFADLTGRGWSEPRVVSALATPGWDGHAVPTGTGWLYFASERMGGKGALDLWRAPLLADGECGEPEPLEALNTEHSESDLCVDREERFIIFGRYVEATREIEMHIAFRREGRWSAPRPLAAVNGPGWELSPALGPEGRMFYFQRAGAVYRADLSALLTKEERSWLGW